MLFVPMAYRVQYEAARNVLFVNLAGVEMKTQADLMALHDAIAACVLPLGRKVPVVVNYDNFSVLPDSLDDYISMVGQLAEQFYSAVTRYSSSAFMRSYLDQAFHSHHLDAALFASQQEALAHLPSRNDVDVGG